MTDYSTVQQTCGEHHSPDLMRNCGNDSGSTQYLNFAIGQTSEPRMLWFVVDTGLLLLGVGYTSGELVSPISFVAHCARGVCQAAERC